MVDHNNIREEWRPISNWEELYEISSLGRIRSLPRRAAGGHGMRSLPARIRRPIPNNHGYLIVTFQDRPRRAWSLVHRLVYETFVSTIPPELEVNHIDGDKINNAVGNLEIVTHAENMAHAKAKGFMLRGEQHPSRRHHDRILKGERHPLAKLTEAEVQTIRRTIAAGLASGSELAGRYGVCPATISNIVRRKGWRHSGLEVRK